MALLDISTGEFFIVLADYDRVLKIYSLKLPVTVRRNVSFPPEFRRVLRSVSGSGVS